MADGPVYSDGRLIRDYQFHSQTKAWMTSKTTTGSNSSGRSNSISAAQSYYMKQWHEKWIQELK